MVSYVQVLADQCLKEKRYLKQFMLESADPFALAIREHLYTPPSQPDSELLNAEANTTNEPEVTEPDSEPLNAEATTNTTNEPEPEVIEPETDLE